jgi:hypothetical protein
MIFFTVIVKMKKKLILSVFNCIVINNLTAQIKWQHCSVNAGMNLFTPILIFRNVNNLKSLSPSWQLGINKDFKILSSSNLRVSIGLTDNAFIAERELINMGPGVFVKKITLGYTHLDVNYIFKKQMKNYALFGGLGLRGSLLCYENFSEMYGARLRSSTYGGNSILGVQFPNMLRKPSLQFNYYHSLTRAAYNSVRVDQGDVVYTDELKNRAVGFQVFFNLI